MSIGLSGRRLALALGVSEGAVRKAVKAKRIAPQIDGTFDENECRMRWSKGTDPSRTKVREPAHQAVRTPAVRTEADAKAAVQLIARVLSDEGSSVSDIDFNAARTADTILKAYERDLKIAQRRKELVPLASVKEHVGKAFIGLRQAIQRIPSRHSSALAAELGCDPANMDTALNKVIAAELDELSTPLVRA